MQLYFSRYDSQFSDSFQEDRASHTQWVRRLRRVFESSSRAPLCTLKSPDKKHLPVYTTWASPPQLVRPHLTYFTPHSALPSCPFCPFGPGGPWVPSVPLGPMSPVAFQIVLFRLFTKASGNGYEEKMALTLKVLRIIRLASNLSISEKWNGL